MKSELFIRAPKYLCIIFCWMFGFCLSDAQTRVDTSISIQGFDNINYIEGVISVGKVFGNFTNYPDRGLRKSIFIHKGKVRFDEKNQWPSFYNYPQTGWTLSFADLGNIDELGYQYSIMPFVEFRHRRVADANWSLYLGLGASYFNRPFDINENANNKSVGGHYTWDLQIFIKRVLYRASRFNLKLGAGFLHASSGHVELPNFGLNSFGVNLSGQFLNNPISEEPFDHPKIKYTHGYRFILFANVGLGLHELGGFDRPIDGPKKMIYTSTIGSYFPLNPHIRLKIGLRYRYYQSFYDYLSDNNTEVLASDKYNNSTSYHIFLGGEFVLGHVGIDGDIGFTLHRPFYDRYYELFREESSFQHFVGKYLPTRLGLNLYVIKPEKLPKHNLSIGAHINANFSTADYSELTIGYYLQI